MVKTRLELPSASLDWSLNIYDNVMENIANLELLHRFSRCKLVIVTIDKSTVNNELNK